MPGKIICCLLMFLPLCLHAQLCQGSLGDPIVNINFGAGSNPGPALGSTATNYQFMNGCPNDGYYTITNNALNCFGWHQINKDHTGNTNGYFMLVNASFQPSAFYIDTIDLLCGSTLYEFAAWITNVNSPSECNGSPIQPNLSFSIENTDGTVIQTYNTGNIPATASPQWKQYGFFFTTPVSAGALVLRIVNNAPGGCGNDLGLDDITFRPCGPVLQASMSGGLTSMSFCRNEQRTIQLNCSVSPGFNNPVFQWQENLNGAGWVDIAGATTSSMSLNFNGTSQPGNYSYRLGVSEAVNAAGVSCRIFSNILGIDILDTPNVALAHNSPVCEGSNLHLSAGGGTQFNWVGPNGFTASSAQVSLNGVNINDGGWYVVEVASGQGCKKKDSVEVIVHPSPVASVSPTLHQMCEGESVPLTGSGAGNYQWTPATGLSSSGISNPVASPVDSTKYLFIVSNNFNCRDTAISQINVFKKPKAQAGPDRTTLKGEGVVLMGNAYGTNVNYSWSPDYLINDISLLQPTVSPEKDTSYVLTVVSQEGCGTDHDTVRIKVYQDIYIPNAFTPDNNGKNDRWRIPGLDGFENYEVKVYNRYGELIYASRNIGAGWDGSYKGKPQPTGIYVYLIEIKDIKRILKGWVLLSR